ncbi:MAG: hypothetical protein JXB47_20830 [Anaerolineae bacterium]|nr:hypothetical protein [Anaerolineae bacterium]
MSAFKPQPLVVLARADDGVLLDAGASGLDWPAIVRALLEAGDDDAGGERWRWLGYLGDLLPSGKHYTLADIGGDLIGFDEAARDLDWLRAAREEAAALGFRVETDGWGGSLYAAAPVVAAVRLGERYLLAV